MTEVVKKAVVRLDTAVTSAGTFESSDLDRSREKSDRITFVAHILHDCGGGYNSI